MAALEAGDETSWLLGYHGEEPAGFLAVGSFDDETWTIVHVGVVPEHRGHGHVSELLAAADRVARERGFASGLSERWPRADAYVAGASPGRSRSPR